MDNIIVLNVKIWFRKVDFFQFFANKNLCDATYEPLCTLISAAALQNSTNIHLVAILSFLAKKINK